MKKFVSIITMCALMITMVGCSKPTIVARSSNTWQKSINQIDAMPDRPSNYKYKDYKDVAIKLDSLIYDFASSMKVQVTDYSTYLPMGYWDKSGVNGIAVTPKFPSYVGRAQEQEAVTVLGTIWGASVAGIDKSNQKIGDLTQNFLPMMKAFYNDEADYSFVLNGKKSETGHTFWYEIYPQVQFIRLAYLYPNETWMKDIILEGAGYWHDALPNFVEDGEPSYAFTSYNFDTQSPVKNEKWNEPPNGGLAMIFYAAYEMTGEQKYLEDCKEVLDYIDTFDKNIYYEILTDYAPYIAAIMNAKHGTNYNIAKFVNYAFEGGADFRGGSQVINANWSGFDVYGLMGFGYNDSSKDGYAFAMNTFHMASTLMPMLKYDSRFADDLGKWMLHMTNSARYFYGNELPEGHSSGDYDEAITDEMEYAIAYEGLKSSENYNGEGVKKPMAMGDPTIHGWGPADLGIYGGGHVGLLGGIVEKTNVEQILQIDLNKNDSFSKRDFDTFLYYNPFDEEKTVNVALSGKKKLHNGVNNKIIASSADGTYALKIPAKTSIILNVLDENAVIEKVGMQSKVGGEVIYSEGVSLDITSVKNPRTYLKKDPITHLSREPLTVDYFTNEGDEVVNMKVIFSGKTIYDGEPTKSLTLDLKGFKTAVTELRVEISTKNGNKDVAAVRVGIQAF